MLRVVIAGLGFGKQHVADLKALSADYELVAVCSAREADAELARRWNTNFYLDYKQMLEQEKPDLFIIAVPPALHAEMAVYAMEQGVDLLIEKPVAASIEDANAIIAAEEATGRKTLVGFQRRLYEPVQRVKEAVASGADGRLTGFVIHAAYPKGDRYFEPAYRHYRKTGGGPVSINGAHDLDLISYICGDVDCVSAMKANTVRGYEVEDTAAITLRTKNGAVGTIFLSDCSNTSLDMTHTFYFEHATYAFSCSSFVGNAARNRLRITKNRVETSSQEVYEEISMQQDMHRELIQHLHRIITQGEQPCASTRDAKKSLQIMLAVQESLDTTQTVKVEA